MRSTLTLAVLFAVVLGWVSALSPAAAAPATDAAPVSTTQPPSGSTATGTPPTDSGGSFGIQLLDAPVSGRNDPRALRYIVDHLAPGTTIERRVLVINKSANRLDVDLYPGAASIEGEQFRMADSTTGNELTGWVAMATDTLQLAAGEQQAVQVTIAVPAAATRGERYGVIWASSSSDGRPGAVSQVNRVGVRIYLDIGPGGDPITDFEIGELTTSRDAGGVPSVAVAVTNTGERALDLTGSANLSAGPAGLGAGPFPVTEGSTLAPGESGRVIIGFPMALPNGPWTIDLDLSSGKVQHTLTSTVTFPDSGGANLTAGSSGTAWWVIGGIVVLALLVLGAALYFARRRTPSGAR